MAFSKKFPRQIAGSNYPEWVEMFLTEAEESKIDQECRAENIQLMKESLEDAEGILEDKNLKNFQSNVVDIAIALFDKRASHSIYWKENKAKEKFDKLD